MSGAKPLTISKQEVWKAYLQVKSNGGAAGVDAESIEAFEQDLKGNLYRLWNRMASGTYFPPSVDTSNPAKRGRRKPGHRGGRSSGCVVARSLRREQVAFSGDT